MRLTDYTPTMNRCTPAQRSTIKRLADLHGADALTGCTRLYNGVVAIRFDGARSYMVARTGGLH